MTINRLYAMVPLLSICSPLCAVPLVAGNTITWLDDGWYQVLSANDYTSICDGGASCEVEPGNYIVINHSTGERYANVVVSDMTVDSGVNVQGNCISWPDDGWYQVQTADEYETICAGGNQCSVDPGTYNVINHTTGTRFENIIVSGVQDVSGVSVDGNIISWPDDGWYQVQSASTNESLCQGGLSCSLAPGTYNVINHSTGGRFEGIEVLSEADEPVPISSQVNLSEPVLGDRTLVAQYSASKNSINVFVQGLDPSIDSWIGLYEEGDPVCTYVTWMYLNGTQAPGEATGEGELQFDVSKIVEGNYSVKFFLDNTFDEFASVSVNISKLLVEYDSRERVLRVEHRNDPESSQDWIALYRTGDPVSSYIARQFLNDSKTVTFSNLELQPAIYSLRYFVHDSAVELYTEDFTVNGPVKDLMYLGFGTPEYGDLKAEHLDVLSDSPYNILAAQLRGAYEQEKIKGVYESLASGDSRVWPWVYLNRMLGSPDAGDTKSNSAPCDDGSAGSFDNVKPVFPINDTNNLHYKDFIFSFKTALELARNSGAAGIVFDTEMYNNSCAVRFPYLSSKLGISPAELERLLMEFGENLADITHSTIKNGVQILVLWNALETNNTITGFIIKGMLERAVTKGYSFKVIESGQGQINWPLNSYFQCSSQLAIDANEKRRIIYYPWIKQYNNNLLLGATTGLLQSVDLATGWVQQIYESCDEESIQTLEDQIPTLDYLFDNFEFVWIYGTSDAEYSLFDAKDKAAIHSTLNSLLSEARN